ncbi:hypothetical protein HanPSC8_Chr17g0786181 [Helianthus annuus]|nr:hypothetical protein HanPSC8_Chr17g0786181 [Helianthus annuus]
MGEGVQHASRGVEEYIHGEKASFGTRGEKFCTEGAAVTGGEMGLEEAHRKEEKNIGK